MKIEEGPLLGALILGVGVGYLMWNKTANPVYTALASFGVAAVDYALIVFIKNRTQR